MTGFIGDQTKKELCRSLKKVFNAKKVVVKLEGDGDLSNNHSLDYIFAAGSLNADIMGGVNWNIPAFPDCWRLIFKNTYNNKNVKIVIFVDAVDTTTIFQKLDEAIEPAISVDVKRLQRSISGFLHKYKQSIFEDQDVQASMRKILSILELEKELWEFDDQFLKTIGPDDYDKWTEQFSTTFNVNTRRIK
jgi:hypothetical protein